MQVLVSKVGKERVYSEAVDSHIGTWFWSAVARSRVRPAAAPEYDYELPANSEQDWRFTAEFAVQPKPDPANWKKLEVAKRAVEVPEDIVTRELEALQGTVADLSPVDSRTAREGDVVVVDIVSGGGFGQRDYVFELGAERIDAGVRGLLAGETRIAWELGTDEQQRHGDSEGVARVLPPLDDELAKSVSSSTRWSSCAAIEARFASASTRRPRPASGQRQSTSS